MDPYKDKILRKSYYSKITKKPKHKQVKLKNFDNEEAAIAFLDKWKDESIKKEDEILKQNTDAPNKVENQNIVIPEIPITTIDIITPQVVPIVENKTESLPNVKYTKFNLHVPNFKNDGNGVSTVLIAASNSGKTTLTKYIINEWFNNNQVVTIMMCPNINIEIYKIIRKDKNLITSDFYNEDLIKDLAKIQRKTLNKYSFSVFLDDIIDEKSAVQLLKMMLIYRNLNISGIINIQDTKLLPRTIRHNANNFIFLRLNAQDAIDDVMELFLNSYEPFINLSKMNRVAMYRELTKDHKFIYLNALEDKISFHEAIQK
jgi:hypothetical protein